MNLDDSDLHALLDGELDAARARQVEAALAADPALAARFNAFKADKRMLRALFAAPAAAPLPRTWLDRIQAHRPAPAMSWRMVGAIAATILLAVLGATLYQRMAAPDRPGEIVAMALAARQADTGVAVSGADASQAISQAIALKVKVPDLRRMGYRLDGARILGRAAELRYRDARGGIFTLYLRHSDGAARFDQFPRGQLRVCVWQDDKLGMVMAGDVSTAAMQRLASLAYTGLTL